MDHRMAAVALKQFRFDQIHMGNLRRKLLDIAVILNIQPYGTTMFAIAPAVSICSVVTFNFTSLYCIYPTSSILKCMVSSINVRHSLYNKPPFFKGWRRNKYLLIASFNFSKKLFLFS
jgi:hypothetical protein